MSSWSVCVAEVSCISEERATNDGSKFSCDKNLEKFINEIQSMKSVVMMLFNYFKRIKISIIYPTQTREKTVLIKLFREFFEKKVKISKCISK